MFVCMRIRVMSAAESSESNHRFPCLSTHTHTLNGHSIPMPVLHCLTSLASIVNGFLQIQRVQFVSRTTMTMMTTTTRTNTTTSMANNRLGNDGRTKRTPHARARSRTFGGTRIYWPDLWFDREREAQAAGNTCHFLPIRLIACLNHQFCVCKRMLFELAICHNHIEQCSLVSLYPTLCHNHTTEIASNSLDSSVLNLFTFLFYIV